MYNIIISIVAVLVVALTWIYSHNILINLVITAICGLVLLTITIKEVNSSRKVKKNIK